MKGKQEMSIVLAHVTIHPKELRHRSVTVGEATFHLTLEN
jgi:hypothetical protein